MALRLAAPLRRTMTTSTALNETLRPLLEFAGWAKNSDGDREVLQKEYKFKDFKTCMQFMNQIADVAEEMGHHPEWWNCYDTLRVTLTTHDASNTVTQKDADLAAAMDSVEAEIRLGKAGWN